MAHKTITTIWPSIVFRSLMFLLIWWVLTDGSAASWWIGLPAVLFAVITSSALVPPVHLAWLECIKFIPFFLRHSMTGGIDVAWRAFHPRLPITPDLIEYPLRLPQGLPSVLMVNIVNLLPGTLSAALDQNLMKVHILDSTNDVTGELASVEEKVARVFGITLVTR